MLKNEVVKGVRDKKVWYCCPNCGKKILRYDELKAESRKLFIKCKNCKKEIEINIE
jgi:transcription elongation factor Elf1